MQKKLMILGASILQLPAIIKAKEMGYEVIAVDMNGNAVGLEFADVPLVISTIDIPAVVEAAKEHKVNGIMTLASDMPIRTVAAVSRELNIPGIDEETALKATNKSLMRKCLKECSVPIPEFFTVNNYDEYISAVVSFKRPFIVKPADNSGSRGIFRLEPGDSLENINYAFEHSKKHSRSKEIIIEEFMEGEEVSVETLSVDGKCEVIQITDKITTGSPRFVEMRHSQPTVLDAETVEKIKEVAIRAVEAIGIKNGPSHTEIIVTKEGPKIVELGARLGGDCITTHLTPFSTGVDMVKNCILIALGEKPDTSAKHNRGAAIRYFESHAGFLSKIEGIREAEKTEGVKEIKITATLNSDIPDIISSSDRLGYIIAEAENAKRATEICEEALKKIKITII